MRKREHVIPLRLNKKEMAYLEKQVAMSRMPREEYLRALVMGGEVRARPCTHHAVAAQGGRSVQQCQSAGPCGQPHGPDQPAERGRNDTACAGGMARRERTIVTGNGIYEYPCRAPPRTQRGVCNE